MEFSHVGDVLHPSPGRCRGGRASGGHEHGRRSFRSSETEEDEFRAEAIAPEASRRVDAALSEEFIGAPGWRVEVVQARQVCGGPLWCVSSGGKGLVACGGSDGVVRSSDPRNV